MNLPENMIIPVHMIILVLIMKYPKPRHADLKSYLADVRMRSVHLFTEKEKEFMLSHQKRKLKLFVLIVGKVMNQMLVGKNIQTRDQKSNET